MKNKLSRFAVPYEVWMAIFVVAPIVIIVVYAFSSADGGFSLENFVNMGEYTDVFLRSFKLALIATAVCLLIGYPVSYWMSREGKSFQRMAMVLIMLPMWMNFLLRTYSWMTILENNGLLNQLFQKIGLIALYNRVTGADVEFFQMINTQGAVVLGMVYNYLPFMILPIYSVIIKLDRSLIEAARDLGANSVMVFRKVILPLSLPGVLSGITMVFVPSVSTFAISRMLGGGTELLLGDLIERQFLGGAYNPQLGAAISLVMMVIVLVFPLLKMAMPANALIGSIASKVDVGLVAFCFTILALLFDLAPQKEVIARVPWNTILMIAGAGMLIAVAVKAGTIDALSAWIGSNVPTPLIPLAFSFVGAFMSFFSSTTGVVAPALFPLIPGLAAATGLNPAALFACTILGAQSSAISPFSSGGSLILGSCGKEEERNQLFNRLLFVACPVSVVCCAVYNLIVAIVL